MPQPGTTPIAAPIDTTAIGDTYPTHRASRGLDDQAVASFAELANIAAPRLSEGMERYAILEGEWYQLQADLTTWTQSRVAVIPSNVMTKPEYDVNDDGVVDNSAALEGATLAQVRDITLTTGNLPQNRVTGLVADLATKGDMFKLTYDPTDSGSVVDSDNLEGQPGSFYLDRTNHTGTQAIATVSNLQTTLDAKVDESLIGVANGIVPLNAGGQIDASYLNITLPLNPVIAWDVVTNTPAISDAGGAAGDVYVVYGSANPTSRDLGSGAINWFDGDWAIYDDGANVFVRIPAFTIGVNQVTTALGVQTGNVTVDDTSYIDPSTDRNYVTDDEDDALAAANSPSGANPFATMNDIPAGTGITQIVTGNGTLTGGTVTLNTTLYIDPSTDRNYVTDDVSDALLAADSPSASNPFATMDDVTDAIVVGNTFLTPELFANGETTGDGTNRTLASLGYNNGTAAAAWPRVAANYPGGLTAAGFSIDAVIWNEMYYYMRSVGASSCITPGGKSYYSNKTIYPPRLQDGVASNRRSLSIITDYNGSRLRNSSGGDMILLDRHPTDQADAMTLVGYQYCFLNGVLRGNGGTTESDTIIRLGASSRSEFRNMNFESAGQMVDLQFGLESNFDNCNISDYGYRGFAIRNGQWSGAGFSNAQSNIVYINQFRSYNSPGNTPEAAIYCSGNHTIYGNLLTHEGDVGPEHHFFYDNPGTLGVNVCNLNNIYMEFSGCSRAAYRFKAGKGQYILNQFRSSVVVGDMPVIIEGDNDRTPTSRLYIRVNNSAADDIDSKLRAVGDPNYPVMWWIENVRMNDNVTLNVAANFETGVVANSYLPPNLACKFIPAQ